MKPNIDNIFQINTSEKFRVMALAIFHYQLLNNEVYRNFIVSLKIDADKITELEQIPFVPVEFFKTHKVLSSPIDEKQETRNKTQETREKSIETGEKTDREQSQQKCQSLLFTSSGNIQSKHYVSDISIYEKSYRKGFELFYGNIEEYCVIALLPTYLEREGSSLIYMAEDLIKSSNHHASGFYLHNYDELILKLTQLELKKQKIILLGVTYALLDLISAPSGHLLKKRRKTGELIIMETGGMKGKRNEMVREELHAVLCNGFGVDVIHSEYGMTELLSQAYSKGNGIFECPPWMKILIRDTNDPFSFLPHGKSGGINIIDLANINSCSFIATQDLGKTISENTFEVLGRFDNSDIRGCNLLIT